MESHRSPFARVAAAPGAARIWHAATFVVAAGAVLLQFALVLRGHQPLAGQSDPGPPLGTRLVRFVSYLTIWGNVLGAATAGLLALDPRRDGRVWRPVRLCSVVLLFTIAVVHWFLLRPLLDLHGVDSLTDTLLHIVVPALSTVGWLVFEPRGRLRGPDLGWCLVIPAAWLLYTLVRGAFVGWYPYPFVDVGVHGYGFVALACLGVGGLLFALALGCWWLDRRLPPRPSEKTLGRSDLTSRGAGASSR